MTDAELILASIGSSVDATKRTIAVAAAYPLELERLLYGAGSPGVRPFDTSGERCFTVDGLEQRVRETLTRAGVGVPIRFTVEPLQPNTGIADARGDRYAEGCTVYAEVSLRSREGRTEVLVELTRRD